jgi:hypothetical protein
MENTITAIPVVSKEVNYFRSSTIKVIPETDRAGIEQLASIEIKEPMFAVSEGERNYIYSFSKVFDGIDKEILKIKENRYTTILMSAVSLVIALFCFGLLKGMGSMTPMIGFFSIIFFVFSLWCMFTTNYKQMIKNLEVKKSYVLNESQNYLKNLEQEVRKPVVVV